MRLLVDAAGLAVDVGLVVVRIENLQLVAGVAGPGGGQEHAAVAARLAGAGDVLGNLPLDVQLVVLEAPLRLDVAAPCALFTVSTPSATVHLAGDLSRLDTHSSRFLPSNSTIASDGGAALVAPGVTTLGTGSHTSVSSGFAAVGCCAERGGARGKAADARNLEN